MSCSTLWDQTHFITKLALCRVAGSPVTSRQPPVASQVLVLLSPSRLILSFLPLSLSLLPLSHTHRRYLTPNAHLSQVSLHVLSFPSIPQLLVVIPFLFDPTRPSSVTSLCHSLISFHTHVHTTSASVVGTRDCSTLETSFSVDTRVIRFVSPRNRPGSTTTATPSRLCQACHQSIQTIWTRSHLRTTDCPLCTTSQTKRGHPNWRPAEKVLPSLRSSITPSPLLGSRRSILPTQISRRPFNQPTRTFAGPSLARPDFLPFTNDGGKGSTSARE